SGRVSRRGVENMLTEGIGCPLHSLTLSRSSPGGLMAQLASPPQSADLESEGLDRGVGFVGLLWASETSIIGSGWLFGALTAALIAGPSAILGWVLGSVIILILPLGPPGGGGLSRVGGGRSRFPHYAFGSF